MTRTTTASGLQERLGSIFDSMRQALCNELSSEEYEQRRSDFIFHMTDWKSDLDQLAQWMKRPDSCDNEAASNLVVGFLYHLIPHLRAAWRVLLDQNKDPFDVTKGQAPK